VRAVTTGLKVVISFVAVAVVAACGDDADRTNSGTAGQSTVDDAVQLDVEDGDGDEDGESTSGGYTHPTGCLTLVPGADWDEFRETGLGIEFSADPTEPLSDLLPPGSGPEPGEPGVLVAANCPPPDQVGALGPVSIPGWEVVDQRQVPFGGGSGELVEYQVDLQGLPPHTIIQVSVEHDGAVCTLQVEGGRDAVERTRAEIDTALSSYTCRSR
jgi:hypothetical protein